MTLKALTKAINNMLDAEFTEAEVEDIISVRTGGVLFSITANTFEMLRSYREDEKLSSKANLEYTIDHLADNKEALMYAVTEVQKLLMEEWKS